LLIRASSAVTDDQGTPPLCKCGEADLIYELRGNWSIKASTRGKYENVSQPEEGHVINLEIVERMETTDVHVKNLPLTAWRVARGAAIIEGVSIAAWVARAILEKWERQENSSHIN
jgi:hypothetical protein